MGFPELFEKKQQNIGSIHFLHGIYHNGVSLLTSIHFCVLIVNFDTLVDKYLAENEVSGI